MSRVISSLLLHHPDLSKIGPCHHKRNSVRRVEDMVIDAIEKKTFHLYSPAFESRVAAATAMWRAGAGTLFGIFLAEVAFALDWNWYGR